MWEGLESKGKFPQIFFPKSHAFWPKFRIFWRWKFRFLPPFWRISTVVTVWDANKKDIGTSNVRWKVRQSSAKVTLDSVVQCTKGSNYMMKSLRVLKGKRQVFQPPAKFKIIIQSSNRLQSYVISFTVRGVRLTTRQRTLRNTFTDSLSLFIVLL